MLDLRGNRGGSLAAAAESAALFLPSGTPLFGIRSKVVSPMKSHRDRNLLSSIQSIILRNMQLWPQHSRWFNHSRYRYHKQISYEPTLEQEQEQDLIVIHSKNMKSDQNTPLLLLTDSITASASEVLAAALIDNRRAISLGAKTFGKNLAQVMQLLDLTCILYC